MAAQIELKQLPPEIETADGFINGEAAHDLSEQQRNSLGSVDDAMKAGDSGSELDVSSHETQAVSKSRKLGRLLMRPFARADQQAPEPVSVTAEEVQGERLQSQTEIDDVRYEEILNSPLMREIPESERAEAAAQTFELYKTAKEVVAPVIVGFADYLLDEAEDRQIIFAGRDGLGAYTAATKLKEKFDYGNSDPDQLTYAYLTRKIVLGTPGHKVGQYLNQLGIRDTDDEIMLADIGMYGTMVSSLKGIMRKVDVRYLISKTSEIPGYADGQETRMASVRSVVGNPAIHFMEDTFSGAVPSPSSLLEKNGQFVPNTLGDTFPPAEALKREFALKAIEDYTSGLDSRPDQPPTEAVKKLDAFLANPDNFKHLMVPHNR